MTGAGRRSRVPNPIEIESQSQQVGAGSLKITGAIGEALRRAAARVRGTLLTLLVATISAGASSMPPQEAASGGVARARFLMGTRLSIETDDRAPEEAIEDAFGEVARLEAILSNWKGTSEISRLNREAARAAVRCSPELFGAIQLALGWAERTGGTFDPTVEPLVVNLGLRGEDGRLPDGGDPCEAPGAGAAAAAEKGPGSAGSPVGWRHVRLDRRTRTARFDTPGVGIDFGGIGKGFALDAAARVLRDHGVRRALLDFGGQVLAMGRPRDTPGWIVGIADPNDRDKAVGVVAIADLSLATSGNSERSIMTPRGAVGHILDPATERPATFTGSVSVAARDATASDALTKALFVMGPEKGVAWADGREIAALYLWRDGDGTLRRRPTRAFENRYGGWTGESEN